MFSPQTWFILFLLWLSSHSKTLRNMSMAATWRFVLVIAIICALLAFGGLSFIKRDEVSRPLYIWLTISWIAFGAILAFCWKMVQNKLGVDAANRRVVLPLAIAVGVGSLIGMLEYLHLLSQVTNE